MSIYVHGTKLEETMFFVLITYDGIRSTKEVMLPFPPFVGLIIEGETVSWKIYEVMWSICDKQFKCKSEMI